jgi:hypothetical protein
MSNPPTPSPPARDLPTIGHVLHRLYLAGAEVLAAALARKLCDRFRFVFFCLDEVGPLGEQLRAEGFEVVDLKRQPGIDLSVATRTRRSFSPSMAATTPISADPSACWPIACYCGRAIG